MLHRKMKDYENVVKVKWQTIQLSIPCLAKADCGKKKRSDDSHLNSPTHVNRENFKIN